MTGRLWPGRQCAPTDELPPEPGDPELTRIFLAKASFWMIIIGAVALVTPHPAWPAWAGWTAVLTGAVLIPVGLLFGARSKKGDEGDRGRSAGP